MYACMYVHFHMCFCMCTYSMFVYTYMCICTYVSLCMYIFVCARIRRRTPTGPKDLVCEQPPQRPGGVKNLVVDPEAS